MSSHKTGFRQTLKNILVFLKGLRQTLGLNAQYKSIKFKPKFWISHFSVDLLTICLTIMCPYALFTSSSTFVRPCNCRDLSSIHCLDVCCRAVHLTNQKEKIIKTLMAGLRLPLPSTCRIGDFANFCPQVLELLLVYESLHIGHTSVKTFCG